MKLVLHIVAIILMAWIFLFISCEKERSCESCKETNKPPIAIAGSDQVITLPTDSILLDGKNSSDPDGKINKWLWTKIAGPASFTIIKPSDSTTKIRALVAGTYQFELKVTDNGGLSAKDTMQLIVDSVVTTKHPPIANAGTDIVITLPTNTANLDGSGSTDPDNDITSYTWTIISGPSSYNIANTNSVQTLITNLVQGVYFIELKVTDAGGLFSMDTIQVIVNPATAINHPPIAKAGNDTIIQSNQTSCLFVSVPITLNGSSSYDQDGTIVSYLWTGTGNITNPNSATTTVNNVSSASFFILKVTDNNGAFTSDTIHISIVPANRPLITAQLIPIGTLSQARWGISVVAAGDKIFFAGGDMANAPATTRVDIYSINTGVWATAELSAPRFLIGAAYSGNKIFFAGGASLQQNSNGWFFSDTYQFRSSVIDIYDVSTNRWSVSQLSSPRAPIGASVNNKVVFAGSDVSYQSAAQSGIIDIYNTSTNSWSSTNMSEIRDMEQPAVTASKIYFPGGSNDFGLSQGFSGGISYKRIDIYDAISDSWSIDSLSRDRLKMGNIIANNKLYCGGGTIWDGGWWDVTNSVEIRDLATNTTSFDCLSEAKDGITAVRKNNKIIFFGGTSRFIIDPTTRFDIYDLTTNSWSIGILPQAISNASIISYNNILYVTNGNQVWKLDF